jgi:hypothetical protein
VRETTIGVEGSVMGGINGGMSNVQCGVDGHIMGGVRGSIEGGIKGGIEVSYMNASYEQSLGHRRPLSDCLSLTSP